jgi:hypothetical protein
MGTLRLQVYKSAFNGTYKELQRHMDCTAFAAPHAAGCGYGDVMDQTTHTPRVPTNTREVAHNALLLRYQQAAGPDGAQWTDQEVNIFLLLLLECQLTQLMLPLVAKLSNEPRTI